MLTELPKVAAWRLAGAYDGFEVVRFSAGEHGIVFDGTTVGVESGAAWSIHYVIDVGLDWQVRRALVTDQTGARLTAQTDGAGSWTVNGKARADLQGCRDLDLEASAVTNTLPIHRLRLAIGERGESAAAYVRIHELAVERLDQSYRRLPDADGKLAFDYQAARFGYHDELVFAPDGLVLDYPGIGMRVSLNP